MGRPRVLAVTGAYFPEFSSGGLQSRAVARELAGRAQFSVFTTSTDSTLPASERVDDVPVTRLYIEPGRRDPSSIAVMVLRVARLLWGTDLVHIQGYSKKNIVIAMLSKSLRRPLILHLQTSRHDEPPAVKAQGRLAWWAFRAADRYISVSPGLKAAAVGGGVPDARIAVVPNGVDLVRFAPPGRDDRARARADLRLPDDRPVVLFVGVMTPDKQPDVLFEAWLSLQSDPATAGMLFFVGATNPQLYELGDRLVERLRGAVAQRGLQDRVRFVEPTNQVEKYFRAADMLVMPSLREGCPNVLLEAMACGLPVIASRLPGATDAIVADGINGRLVDAGNVAAFARAMADILANPGAAADMGRAARRTMEERFSIQGVARQWLAVYDEVRAAR